MGIVEVYMPAISHNWYSGFPLERPEPVGATVYRTRAGAETYLEGYQPVSGLPMEYFTIIKYVVES